MKKFMRKALASMLMFTMCFSSVNISAFAQNVDEIDTTTEVVIEQTTDDTIEETTSVDEFIAKSETAAETDAEPAATSDYSGWDQTTTEKIFEGENFNVYFTLSSNWDAGYNATIKLENTGEELKALSHDNRPEDFQYADKSIDQLRDMKYINWTDFFGVETNDYVYSWKSLVKLTSTGDMQDVAIDMVNHFMDGTASDYWNATLTKKMEKHSSSEKYTSDIINIINSYIKENDGDISGLIYNTNNRDNLSLIKQMRANKVYAPVYKDKFSGLGICVDSLYGNEIEITSYKFDGTNYEYTLKFTLYDIYGLDSADIEEKKYVDNITGFGLLAGFRSWYILQHCNLYGGDYQPFITYASFEKTVKGNIK